MKLISANKLNRLWNNGVVAKMVAKTKILKTLEEIEANTNEENVAGATALKEVNNKLMFPDGTEFYLDIKDGERGYNSDPARGADTFNPFKNFSKLKQQAFLNSSGATKYTNFYLDCALANFQNCLLFVGSGILALDSDFSISVVSGNATITQLVKLQLPSGQYTGLFAIKVESDCMIRITQKYTLSQNNRVIHAYAFW